jgi:murein peptide amidase A
MKPMLLVIVTALLTVGCAAPGPQQITPVPQSVRPHAGAIIGYSVQRRPIELHTFSPGEHPVLIIAAIHGDEPTSAVVATALINLLAQYPQTLANVPVAIVPIMNPDGYAAGTRVNARKVDLNRNFPAANFSAKRRSPRSFGGSSPLSEPESAALDALITRLNPRLIISIHSRQDPCNNYDGPAKHIAELMSRYNRYPVLSTIGYPTPGSLGSYAGQDKQIPIITLELARRASGEQAWKENKDALLAAIQMMK